MQKNASNHTLFFLAPLTRSIELVMPCTLLQYILMTEAGKWHVWPGVNAKAWSAKQANMVRSAVAALATQVLLPGVAPSGAAWAALEDGDAAGALQNWGEVAAAVPDDADPLQPGSHQHTPPQHPAIPATGDVKSGMPGHA